MSESVEPERVLSPGDTFADRFVVRALLGGGPLGETWRAHSMRGGGDVALKLLAPELYPTDKERSALQGHVNLLVGRTIAGCVLPTEAGDDEGWVWCAAPLIDGVSLRSVLAARNYEGRGIEPEEALRVLLALAAACSALHSATPHGALRPANVLVTSKGLLLTDCALAVAVPGETLSARLESFGDAAAFVSPEVAAGRKITAVADLYSLGAIAAELLSGTPGLSGADNLVEQGSPLGEVVQGLLERDRTKRPAFLGPLLDGLSRQCGFERRPLVGRLPEPSQLPALPWTPEAPQSASPAPPGAPKGRVPMPGGGGPAIPQSRGLPDAPPSPPRPSNPPPRTSVRAPGALPPPPGPAPAMPGARTGLPRGGDGGSPPMPGVPRPDPSRQNAATEPALPVARVARRGLPPTTDVTVISPPPLPPQLTENTVVAPPPMPDEGARNARVPTLKATPIARTRRGDTGQYRAAQKNADGAEEIDDAEIESVDE